MGTALTTKSEGGISSYLNKAEIKANIEGVIGKDNVNSFITDIVACVNNNADLSKCTNKSILSGALVAKSVNLSLAPHFGHAYLVPFSNKKTITGEDGRKRTEYVDEAQLNIGWKGYYQLAMRSRIYKKIVACDVRKGEVSDFNPFTNEYSIKPIPFEDRMKKDAKGNWLYPVIGYYAMFETVEGFKHELYMTKEDMQAFAQKYSKAYRSDIKNGYSYSFWTISFDDMALKTMYRQLLSKYGMLTPEMQKAYVADMGIVQEDGSVVYADNQPDEPRTVDNPLEDVIDVEAKVFDPMIGSPDELPPNLR